MVPSFAKEAKLGQPLLWCCGQEPLKLGQPPLLDLRPRFDTVGNPISL